MALMNGVMSERMDVEATDWFTPASNGERSRYPGRTMAD